MNNLKKYTIENLIEYLMQAHLEIVNQDTICVGNIQVILQMKVNKNIRKIIVATSYSNLLKQLLTEPLCLLSGYEVKSVKVEQFELNKGSTLYKLLKDIK